MPSERSLRRQGITQGYSVLSLATVTSASRIMIPTYPLMCLALAVNYIADPPRMMLSPALITADRMLPLPVWGVMFGVAGLILVIGIFSHGRTVYLAGLVVMCAAMSVWAAVFTYSAITDQASYTAPIWPAFAAAACWATIRSLTTRETS